MSYTMLHQETKNAVSFITLDHASTLNALDTQMASELEQALLSAESDREVKVILLTGAGRAFCGGGDIRYMSAHANDPEFAEECIAPLAKKLSHIVLLIKQMTKPVVCAVAGAAAGGGCNLALACDIIFAADNAKFIQAFVGIGLLPDTGGAYLLPRLIGSHRAAELFLTGRPVDAAEAKQLGLVKTVTTPETLLSQATAFSEELATGPSLAYACTKRLLFISLFREFETFAKEENTLVKRCAESHDFREGITAFLEKRAPHYKGI